MEATIYQRVKLVLDDKSISVNALSKQINVAQATHVVEELGYTTKYSHRIELSESGESQIEKFWRESKYNPDNVWKSRVVKLSSVITAIISLVYFLAWLCQLIQNSVKK